MEHESNPELNKSDQQDSDMTAIYLAILSPLGMLAAGLGYAKYGPEVTTETITLATASIIGGGIAAIKIIHPRQQG